MRLFCVCLIACASSPQPAVLEPVAVQVAAEPEPDDEPEPEPTGPPVDLVRGQAAFETTGVLEEGDAQHPRDQSYYDRYTLFAEQGDQIIIGMESDEFDTYLQLRIDGSDDAEFLMEHDDVPGSTNSALSVLAPRSGVYVLWANAFSAGETGTYTLRMEVELAE